MQDRKSMDGVYPWQVLWIVFLGVVLVAGAGCPASGTPGPYCGDGVVDLGESCDDGNEMGCDGCSISCHLEGCGNGIVECGEECDDGNIINGDGCSSVCEDEPGICGDGNLDAGEECDDGNTTGGDGCAADCTSESGPVCGDGTQEGSEECDDGNITACDGCSATCTIEVCGNGTQECTEECDDGNTTDGDGCAADCTLESNAVCGDGTQEGGEGCDDGNTTACDGCSATCQVEECGNGTQECGEGCDDGNTTDCDGCSATCQLEECGNGTQECAEGCDDGNTSAGDGCSATCQIEPYSHTIVIDGTNDFSGDDTFTSGTSGHTGYVAWDSTYLYVGFDSPDLATDSALLWFQVYLGGSGTSRGQGETYNTQSPALPFNATHHFRHRADNTYSDMMETDGSSWMSVTFNGNLAFAGSYVEVAIPLADLGNPTTVDVHLNILREQSGNEATWAGVPSTSFVDGYDPDFTTYYQFDLSSAALPNSYSPL